MNFRHRKLLQNDTAIVFQREPQVMLKSPLSIAFTVLEYAKYQLYADFYFRFRPVFGPQTTLLFTDTGNNN